LFLQEPGHSVTIIGIDRKGGGPFEYSLYVLDPVDDSKELLKALQPGGRWGVSAVKGVATPLPMSVKVACSVRALEASDGPEGGMPVH
jgi:hypothetical protein